MAGIGVFLPVCRVMSPPWLQCCPLPPQPWEHQPAGSMYAGACGATSSLRHRRMLSRWTCRCCRRPLLTWTAWRRSKQRSRLCRQRHQWTGVDGVDEAAVALSV
eukprot:353843-Chlamydomonas_euryale.AAC.14